MGCSCEKLAGNDVSLSPVCIGNLWMFKDLAPLEQQMLADRASRRQRTKGQFVFQQGDRSTEMFLLKSGRVKLSKILENGNQITLDIRTSGDFIGENMLIEEIEYLMNALPWIFGDDTEVTPEKFCTVEGQDELWREGRRLGEEIAQRLRKLQLM